ncbi:MAG: phenylalanine--tRNA ligase subunit alpha [Mycobacteriales bacterium]
MPDYDPVQVSPLHADHLARAAAEASAAITAATDLDQLAAARSAYLGDRSPIALARSEIGALPPQARKEAGQRVNAVLEELRALLAERTTALESARDARALTAERVDVTLPWDRRPRGARHPLTTIQELVADIFIGMGFDVAEGPEVETEWHNFDALNMGPDHPARTMHDTIWVDPPEHRVLLRTHTSPVQVRALLSRSLPVYVVVPGRVVRNDPVDATHSPVFHQLECLVVDEGITMAHLRGVVEAFARAVFGPGLGLRIRPSYFPFTEPSAEFDLQCFGCRGAGCRICAFEGWIEWGGAGMVHPNVLLSCGVDPERYSGFAFGMGLERLLMFRHGINDLRHLFDGDIRFGRAFGMEV